MQHNDDIIKGKKIIEGFFDPDANFVGWDFVNVRASCNGTYIDIDSIKTKYISKFKELNLLDNSIVGELKKIINEFELKYLQETKSKNYWKDSRPFNWLKEVLDEAKLEKKQNESSQLVQQLQPPIKELKEQFTEDNNDSEIMDNSPLIKIEENNIENTQNILRIEQLQNVLRDYVSDQRGGDPTNKKIDSLNHKTLDNFIYHSSLAADKKLDFLEELFRKIINNVGYLYTHTNKNKQGKELTATQKRHIGLLKEAYVAIVKDNSQNIGVKQKASTIQKPEGLVDYNRTYGYKSGIFRSPTTSKREEITAILNPSQHFSTFMEFSICI